MSSRANRRRGREGDAGSVLDRLAIVEADIAALQEDKTGKGVTAQAQFYQDLFNAQKLHKNTDDLETFLQLTEVHALPSSVHPQVPAKGGSEALVQAEFERCLEVLRSNEGPRSLMNSVPLKDAYQLRSFDTRKPDLVNHEKSCTGSMAITFFGDCKKPGLGDFADEEIGHVLDMGRAFMENVGYYREKLIVFLSDGGRWQFFIVNRHEDGLFYEMSKVIDDNLVGWNIFWSLLKVEATTLGYKQPKVNNVTLLEPLGRGGSATVYRGTYNDDDKEVLIKMFRTDQDSSFKAERKALETLKDLQGTPKLQHVARVECHEQYDCYPKALIVAPLAFILRTDVHRRGRVVSGMHLKQLVTIVQSAHQMDLIHRDIKPDNAYLTSDGALILNDWGASVSSGDDSEVWKGTYGFSVTPEERAQTYWSNEICDLVALVRTAYVLVCKESPPTTSGEAATAFWRERIRAQTVWDKALTLAVAQKYDALGDLLSSLK